MGAVFVGEGRPPSLDVPVVDTLEEALDAFAPDQVVELADEPPLDAESRFAMAALALSRDVGWRGGGWSLEPPLRPRLTERPAIAVIGTGRGAGKTALARQLARRALERGRRPVVVAMSGGRAVVPEVWPGDIPRVMARCCGTGLTGTPTSSTYVAAVLEAVRHGDVLILQGMGSAVPTCAAGATVLAVPAFDQGSHPLFPLRVLIAHAVVITMSVDSGAASGEDGRAQRLETRITRIEPSVSILRTVFRPYPLEPISGQGVHLVTSAPPERREGLVHDLQARWGARVVGASHLLDEARAAGAEVVMAEPETASADEVARFVAETGKKVVPYESRLDTEEGRDLTPILDGLLDTALASTS